MSTKTIHGNSQFQKPPSLRWTWESSGGQFHNEIDHIIFNRKYCLTDVSIVPNFYTGSDHRLLRAKFRFSRQRQAAKFTKKSPRTAINWDLYTPRRLLGRHRHGQHRRGILPLRAPSPR
ncbi:unnamed protein product [Heligmosomoides polygyrus]|uniref:Endo/exonuclease/phosphatase domain-containing protein n=1 Tax=Heligmosomoides polygyrus TaxID=6339 RepID=A0A183FGH8_HELPZ|nr:unnamed protein product [Heligmosomoides polygyrus]